MNILHQIGPSTTLGTVVKQLTFFMQNMVVVHATQNRQHRFLTSGAFTWPRSLALSQLPNCNAIFLRRHRVIPWEPRHQQTIESFSFLDYNFNISPMPFSNTKTISASGAKVWRLKFDDAIIDAILHTHNMREQYFGRACTGIITLPTIEALAILTLESCGQWMGHGTPNEHASLSTAPGDATTTLCARILGHFVHLMSNLERLNLSMCPIKTPIFVASQPASERTSKNWCSSMRKQPNPNARMVERKWLNVYIYLSS
jgi:hypothetical protein